MTAMDCEAFRRGWKEKIENTEDNSNPAVELFAHMDNCESCRQWCDNLFTEQVASLGVSLKELGDMLQDLQDELEALAESDKEPKN